eukprot:503159_1
MIRISNITEYDKHKHITNNLKWKPGDLVDVYDTTPKFWYIATIFSIFADPDDLFNYEYDVRELGDKYGLRIPCNKSSDLIHPLNTHTIPLTKISTAWTFGDLNYTFKPIYDKHTDSLIFICEKCDETDDFNRSTNDIYIYNVTANKYNKLSVNIPDLGRYWLCNVTFHEEIRSIYLFYHSDLIIVFNIETLTFAKYTYCRFDELIPNIGEEVSEEETEEDSDEETHENDSSTDEDDSSTDEYDSSTDSEESSAQRSFVSFSQVSTIGNYIHLRLAKRHYKLNVLNMKIRFSYTGDTITKMQTCKPGELIYVDSLMKLFDFSGYDDSMYRNGNIYYCDIRNSNQNNFEWKKYNLCVPGLNWYFQSILAFKHFVFFFFFSPFQVRSELDSKYNSAIYVMDLCYNQMFKYESERQLSYLWNEFKMVKDVHNNVHVIYDDKWGDDRPDDPHHFVHYKFSLYDVIPNKMNEFYQKKYKPLVYGFVGNVNKECLLVSNVPNDLIEMIFCYFPLFL